jgi:twitching motility protein PilT
MKSIDSYFRAAVDAGASDIHLIAGQVPMMRIDGQLSPLESSMLPAQELKKAVEALMTTDQKKQFDQEQDLDIGYDIKGHRFRLNIHIQGGSIGLAARSIPKDIPPPQELLLSDTVQRFADLNDGLVLVVGPTGSGKSTTIASLVESINLSRKAHIITIEDPIEFTFNNKEAIIEQREVGIDTPTFASALKHVLRQDPDVIVVGEMRDPETISTVLTAAETGHLVFSTLHTSSTAEAIERIVDVFEGAKQRQVLIQLGSVLRGVVFQELVPKVGGGRVAVREVLVNTPAISNVIRENNISQIKSILQTNKKDGMIPKEAAITQLVKDNLISADTANAVTSGTHV